MAYTLTDPFRSLRSVLRLSGVTMILSGAALTFAPVDRLVEWDVAGSGPSWPIRLAGTQGWLIGHGCVHAWEYAGCSRALSRLPSPRTDEPLLAWIDCICSSLCHQPDWRRHPATIFARRIPRRLDPRVAAILKNYASGAK